MFIVGAMPDKLIFMKKKKAKTKTKKKASFWSKATGGRMS